MSLKRLDGWEPRVVTDYTYDDAGRLIGSVVTPEPEWDEEQVAWLLASERLEADLGPHGHPMSEATSEEADPSREGGYRYLAPDIPSTDWAQKEIDQKRSAYEKKWPNASTAGHVWRVRRVDS